MENFQTYDLSNNDDVSNASKILKISNENLLKITSSSVKAKSNSYSPYSKFRVGSVVYTTNEEIISGCNVENISYGLAICAERSAICSAISQGYDRNTMYILSCTTDRSDFLTPCGACRQFLVEFPSIKHVIILNNNNQIKLIAPLDLLPFRFDCEL